MLRPQLDRLPMMHRARRRRRLSQVCDELLITVHDLADAIKERKGEKQNVEIYDVAVLKSGQWGPTGKRRGDKDKSVPLCV